MTARGAMEKSRYFEVIEGEEVKRNDPIEYSSPRRSEVIFESQRR